jgi:hypothetical protein
MSKRRKGSRGPTKPRCSRRGCTAYATHLLLDPDGEDVRSCDACWPGLVVAIRSLGGHVGECSCRLCGPRSVRPATGAPARRASAEDAPGGVRSSRFAGPV